MDDELGPATVIPNEGAEDGGDDSGEEDLVDWTKVPGANASSKQQVIPKRGEKDFEPAAGGGSGLQQYSLERSRQAMISALSSSRSISSKSISYAMWMPGLQRAQVFQARGVLFTSIGHSVRRSVPSAPGEKPRTVATLELLPEEALYLVERGSMLCFRASSPEKESRLNADVVQNLDVDGSEFAQEPMTVQQAFAEMIGKEDLTLPRYQCYSYLKRLGFVVWRANAPFSTPSYPLPPPFDLSPPRSSQSLLSRFGAWLASLLPRWLLRIRSPIKAHDPLFRQTWSWLTKCDYPKIFSVLRVIPSGHRQPLSISPSEKPKPPSPYKVFYHIWKPNTAWKKSAPPLPDFELVVIDGRTTPIPSIEELTDLFGALPYVPPPLPRQRRTGPQPKSAPASSSAPKSTSTPSASSSPDPVRPSFLYRLLHPFSIFSSRPAEVTRPRKPLPFSAIRAGNKNVIIGVVDAGNVSFFRFGEGCFDEWPMV